MPDNKKNLEVSEMEKFNKAGKGAETFIAIAVVLVAIMYAMQSGFLSSFQTAPQAASGGASGGSSGASSGNTVTVVGAPCTQGTTLTASVIRRYTDVAQTSENVTIYQNGVLKGTVAHGSTATVQSGTNGDKLDLYVASDRSATFYTRHLKGTIGTCTASATTGDSSFKDVVTSEDLGSGVKLGSPVVFSDYPNKVLQMDTNGNSNWFSIVNDGQANQNTGGQGEGTGANLTIGTGGSASVTITFRPGYNAAIGPNGNVLACQFPQAILDSSAPLLVTYGGKLLDRTDTKPSTQNYPLRQSNNTVVAFAFPGVNGRETTKADIGIVLKADSNRNPGGAVDRVNCTMFDSNFYQRQSDGKLVLDIENRDTNANIGLGATGGTGGVVIANPEPSFEIGLA